MDSIFNLVIILIPLGIFIGRIVVQARSKQSPPKPQPRIPVHFEDDDEYEGPKASQAYALAMPAKEQTPKPKANLAPSLKSIDQKSQKGQIRQKGQKSQKNINPASPESPYRKMPGNILESGAAAGSAKAPASGIAASKGQMDFLNNLSHLSALKQAVVMAEVLGPPKALQGDSHLF